jgi:soluble P-type ATPase
MKPGIDLDIPGFGKLELRRLVSDYTGTWSYGGKITRGVERRLVALSELLDIHVLTADTFGTAAEELRNIPMKLVRLEPGQEDARKMEYVLRQEPRQVVAFGNGANDRLLLKTVKEAGSLAIAVDNGEGCGIETILNASLFITGAENALDLLLEPDRLKATLRF